jgi:aryl-alcohol dehydrogenase-like predicted oxidoreductase
MIPLCRDLGVGGNPYSPRARGFLTHHSRYADGERTPRASNDPLAESMYGDDDLAVVAAVVPSRGAALPPSTAPMPAPLSR